jgi:hypothetical protein
MYRIPGNTKGPGKGERAGIRLRAEGEKNAGVEAIKLGRDH